MAHTTTTTASTATPPRDPGDLSPFARLGLTDTRLAELIDDHEARRLPRFSRLWDYYANEPDSAGNLPQQRGLPPRLRGKRQTLADDRRSAPETVVENDIAWRIEAGVDFTFGKPVAITSTARDENLRATINAVLDAVWESSGGIALLQDMALLGSVYGHIDLILRTGDLFQRARDAGAPSPEQAVDLARSLRIELVEPPRAIPLLDPGDWRLTNALVIRALIESDAPARPNLLARLTGRASTRHAQEVIEVLSADHHLVRIDGRTIRSAPNPLGELPVVHVQNTSRPFRYEGRSDVEPLIPIQDELNTRLSDRAHRVTLQSFKMYLARGLDALAERGVSPGIVWTTDNPDAQITEFGGDAHSPSEADHVDDLRDAMDKTSAISPVALGVVRAKLGHLSSENALRITLNGVLAKTERKRISYGRGMARMCRLILLALDRAGVLATEEIDRAVRLQWPEPLPLDQQDRLRAAQLKLELGVPREQVLAELGYAPADAGIT